ncbi:MAG: peptidylprolyl isomerase [Parachlamydiaceae bacterium]
MKIINFLLAACSVCLSLESAANDPFFFGKDDKAHIAVNNRVLAYVNHKAITVLDVMKKMDMLFLKQFPEYTTSPQARMQYYQVNWKHFLQELIDKELILADAEENKMVVSTGDVRQEMETLFGPNIIENLDKIGLQFDEAFKIVQGDITIRRMMMARVNSKAMRGITPQVIREAYDEFSKNNVKKEEWHYQVVTVKNPDPTSGAETAQIVYTLLTDEKTPIDQVAATAKEKAPHLKSSITLSEDIFQTEDELNETIKSSIATLEPGTFSRPIPQKSRTDKSTNFRIVFLKEKVAGGAVPYSEIEVQIKNQLYEKAIEQESIAYLKKLRTHYAINENYIQEMIPDTFQPFSLK